MVHGTLVGGVLSGCEEFVFASFRARQDQQGYGVVVCMLSYPSHVEREVGAFGKGMFTTLDKSLLRNCYRRNVNTQSD